MPDTAFPAAQGIFPQPYANVVGAGTAYSLTATSAAIDFGTTDPIIALPNTGRYLILAYLNLKYAAATFAATRAVTLKIRRTNNTAADLATTVLATGVITTLTYTFFNGMLYCIVDATALDAITLFADVAVIPTAGTLDVIEARISAIQIG